MRAKNLREMSYCKLLDLLYKIGSWTYTGVVFDGMVVLY